MNSANRLRRFVGQRYYPYAHAHAWLAVANVILRVINATISATLFVVTPCENMGLYPLALARTNHDKSRWKVQFRSKTPT